MEFVLMLAASEDPQNRIPLPSKEEWTLHHINPHEVEAFAELPRDEKEHHPVTVFYLRSGRTLWGRCTSEQYQRVLKELGIACCYSRVDEKKVNNSWEFQPSDVPDKEYKKCECGDSAVPSSLTVTVSYEQPLQDVIITDDPRVPEEDALTEQRLEKIRKEFERKYRGLEHQPRIIPVSAEWTHNWNPTPEEVKRGIVSPGPAVVYDKATGEVIRELITALNIHTGWVRFISVRPDHPDTPMVDDQGNIVTAHKHYPDGLTVILQK